VRDDVVAVYIVVALFFEVALFFSATALILSVIVVNWASNPRENARFYRAALCKFTKNK
tara:strand:+ start:3466 stop:3642 length:177 start_codon:yes stop_codon:yes gene_type:complete